MDLAAALRSIELFRDVPEAGLEAIAAIGEPVAVGAGDTILVEGGPADAFWVVLSGECRVYTERGGAVQSVVTIGPGEPFGASALLVRGARSATVVATEPTELVAFRAEPLVEILRGDVRTAAPFYRALAAAIFLRMRETTNELGFARLEARDLHDS